MRSSTAEGGRWLVVLGFLLLTDLSVALVEVHVEQKSVTAVEGHGITLPIWYSSSSEEKPYVMWYIQRDQGEQVQILKYMDGETSVAPDFKDRLRFAHAMPTRNISIVINRTLATDAGKYRCYVNVKNDDVSGSSNIGVVDVSILEPSLRANKAAIDPFGLLSEAWNLSTAFPDMDLVHSINTARDTALLGPPGGN